MKIIDIRTIDVLFGFKHKQKHALKLLEQKSSRTYIKEICDVSIGVEAASLQIHKGEIFVLMGLSGSGKSTLLRSINGLVKAIRGELIVYVGPHAIDVVSCSASTLRSLRQQHVAMVFQSFALLPWRTVEENVYFGLEVAHMGKAERQEKAAQVLQTVGLLSWRKSMPHELSGGMQQRVGLARALATDAEILLMDEPFSALDPLIRLQLQDEICRLQQELSKTIVFVSHDFDEAARIGTRMAIMNEGRIVQVGSVQEIISAPENAFVERFISHAKK